MTTSLLASSVLVLAGMLAAGAAGMLTSSIMSHGKRREDLYAGCTLCDGATRRKVPRLEQLARGRFCRPPHDVTPNVPSVRRRLERYAGIPGTAAFERLRTHDRMYFIACLTVARRAR